jgi:hypothetical protein
MEFQAHCGSRNRLLSLEEIAGEQLEFTYIVFLFTVLGLNVDDVVSVFLLYPYIPPDPPL